MMQGRFGLQVQGSLRDWQLESKNANQAIGVPGLHTILPKRHYTAVDIFCQAKKWTEFGDLGNSKTT